MNIQQNKVDDEIIYKDIIKSIMSSCFPSITYDKDSILSNSIDRKKLILSIQKEIKNTTSSEQIPQNIVPHNYEWMKEFISIAYMDRQEIIRADDILFCTADGRYTIFKLSNGKQYMSSKNLAEYTSFFEFHSFFYKISRSCVVNFKHIEKIIKKDGMHCILSDGSSISVARRKYSDLNKFLNSLGDPSILF